MLLGQNLLYMALSVIGSTPVIYYSYLSRETNAGGIDVTSYNAGIVCSKGSVQAIPTDKYERLGLDFTKEYITWLVPNLEVIDLSRDVSGDVIEVFSKRWQLIGASDWLKQDGWDSIKAVCIGAATGLLTSA